MLFYGDDAFMDRLAGVLPYGVLRDFNFYHWNIYYFKKVQMI